MLAVLSVLGFSLVFSDPAAARTPAPATTSSVSTSTAAPRLENGGGQGRDVNQQCVQDSMNAANSHLLPVNRWNDATSDFHTRTSSGDIWDGVTRQGRAISLSSAMSFGNFLYATSSSLVTTANGFCVLDRIGASLDFTTAKIGDAIFNSPLMVGLLVVGLIGVFFNAYRNRAAGQLLKGVGTKVAIVALFGLMLTGAHNSTPRPDRNSPSVFDSTQTAQPYRPGFGSPGFWAVTVDDTVTALANAPVGALYKAFLAGDNPDAATADKNWMSCDRYVAALRKKYYTTYGDDPMQQTAASVPMVLDSIWTASGLQAYKRIQFGSSRFADDSYCHYLDIAAGVPVTYDQRIGASGADGTDASKWDDYSVEEVLNVVHEGFGDQIAAKAKLGSGDESVTDAIVAGAPAWTPQGNTEADSAIVGWAACRVTGTGLTFAESYDGDYASRLVQPGGIPDQQANLAAQALNSATGGAVGTAVNGASALFDMFRLPAKLITSLSSTTDLSAEFAKNPTYYSANACKNFFTSPDYTAADFNWGNSDGTVEKEAAHSSAVRDFVMTAHGANMQGATAAMLYVLSAICTSIVFGLLAGAIIFAKVMAAVFILAVFFVLLAALVTRDASGIARFGKAYLGMSLFSVGAVAILAVVAILTQMFFMLGESLGGRGSYASILWCGVSPMLAVYGVHKIFTGLLRLPSPFKITGGLAYAATAGAAGGAMTAGLMNGFGRRKMAELRSAAANTMTSAAGNRIGNRSGEMPPDPKSKSGNKNSEGDKSNTENEETKIPGELNKDGTPRSTAAERRAAKVSALTGNQVQSASRADVLAARAQKALDPATWKAAASQSMDSFRRRPVQTIGRGVGKAVKVGAAAGAIGLTGGAAAPVIAGMMVTKRYTGKQARERIQASDQEVINFRKQNEANRRAADEAEQARQDALEKQQAKAAAEQEAAKAKVAPAEEAAPRTGGEE